MRYSLIPSSEVTFLFGFLLDTQVASIGVERTQHFASLPGETHLLPAPGAAPFQVKKGSIIFNLVSLRYPGSTNLALKGLSLSVKIGERIGICGRTGT